jgi:hypothetical protein
LLPPDRLKPVAVLVLVLIAAAAAGCGSGRKASDPSATATFRNSFLAIGYPADWQPEVFPITGVLHFSPMLYLSSQPLHQPCQTKQSTTTCGWPVERLRPGGVLIVWENRGYPGWSLATTQGTSLKVGGRAAKKTVSRPGACSTIGADETIAIEISRPIPNNWTAVTACLRGPGLAASERKLAALLGSTRFLSH